MCGGSATLLNKNVDFSEAAGGMVKRAKKKQKADAVGLKMKQDTLRRYTSHRSTSGIGGTYTISTWPSSYGVGL